MDFPDHEEGDRMENVSKFYKVAVITCRLITYFGRIGLKIIDNTVQSPTLPIKRVHSVLCLYIKKKL